MTIATNILPTVDFCGTELTRLMIGGNEFRGYSHFSEELNVEMREYYSVKNAAQTLLRAEECGINCMQSRGDGIIFSMVEAYRSAGGLFVCLLSVRCYSARPLL